MLADNIETGFKQSLLLKDLGICKQLAHDLNIELPVTDLTHRDYTQRVAAGDGENEISGLIRFIRSLCAGND